MTGFIEKHEESAVKARVKLARGKVLQPEEEGIAEFGVNPQGCAEAEKVAELSEPSRELATKILTEVGFKERLVGVTMHPRAGNTDILIYSFEEATVLLHYDAGNLGIEATGSIGYINLNALQKWVGDIYGDKELAEIIRERIKAGGSFKEQVEYIKPLMEQRLRQCKGIVGADTEA